MEKAKSSVKPDPKKNNRIDWINQRKKFIKEFFKKFKLNNDLTSITNFIMIVLLDGLVASTALIFFKIPFTFLNILSLGCLVWFVERRVFPIIRRNFVRDRK